MKALVLFSGGIDSTTALGLAIKKYGKEQVIALSVSYGQKHDNQGCNSSCRILWRGASVPGFKQDISI